MAYTQVALLALHRERSLILLHLKPAAITPGAVPTVSCPVPCSCTAKWKELSVPTARQAPPQLRRPPRSQLPLPQQNPIAHYKFDESGGTTASDSSGTNTATLVNGPVFTQGQVNNALSLDGIDDYARITRTAALESPSISLSAWIKRNGTQVSYANVFRKTWQNNAGMPFASYTFQLNPTGDSSILTFSTGHQGSVDQLRSAAGTIPDNIWVHVVGTYDPAANQKNLYINGSLNASRALSLPILYDATQTGDLYAGTNGGGAEYYKGMIDDLRVYNRALTQAEIQTLANPFIKPTPTPTPTPGPISCSQYTPSTTIPTGFASPYDVASPPQAQIS